MASGIGYADQIWRVSGKFVTAVIILFSPFSAFLARRGQKSERTLAISSGSSLESTAETGMPKFPTWKSAGLELDIARVSRVLDFHDSARRCHAWKSRTWQFFPQEKLAEQAVPARDFQMPLGIECRENRST